LFKNKGFFKNFQKNLFQVGIIAKKAVFLGKKGPK
jgi:hypothetical protein